jgi:predicted Zn finger-like uncharacterized protein
MRIVCPNCSAEYEVPEARLRAGRAVRCARCGGTWVPEPAQAADVSAVAAPAPAPVAPPVPSTVERAGFDLADLPAAHDAFEPPAEVERVRVREPFADPEEVPATDAPRSAAPALRLEEPLLPRTAPPARRSSPAGALLEWGLSALALACLLWAAYAWRDTIMQAWPPSIRVYAALGIG